MVDESGAPEFQKNNNIKRVKVAFVLFVLRIAAHNFGVDRVGARGKACSYSICMRNFFTSEFLHYILVSLSNKRYSPFLVIATT